MMEPPMDVEKTMQFILDQQAKAEVRWQRADERMDRFERSLDGLRKLVHTGMKMLVRAAEEQRETRVTLREMQAIMRGMQASIRDTQVGIQELTAAQQRADRKFDRLVELLSRRSPNGRH